MTAAAVFGSTGAVGRHILDAVLASDAFASVQTVSRRPPKAQSPKLEAVVETDTSRWETAVAGLRLRPAVVFNAVGTTRAAAGGLEAQWKIDHDLCVANARAAKEAGADTYVFVSSGGTRGLLSAYVPYSKMKIGVEDAVRGLGFEHAIVLRPGLILGPRETPKAPLLEKVVGSLHMISPWAAGLARYVGRPRRPPPDPELTWAPRPGPEDDYEGGGGGGTPRAGGSWPKFSRVGAPPRRESASPRGGGERWGLAPRGLCGWGARRGGA